MVIAFDRSHAKKVSVIGRSYALTAEITGSCWRLLLIESWIQLLERRDLSTVFGIVLRRTIPDREARNFVVCLPTIARVALIRRQPGESKLPVPVQE